MQMCLWVSGELTLKLKVQLVHVDTTSGTKSVSCPFSAYSISDTSQSLLQLSESTCLVSGQCNMGRSDKGHLQSWHIQKAQFLFKWLSVSLFRGDSQKHLYWTWCRLEINFNFVNPLRFWLC